MEQIDCKKLMVCCECCTNGYLALIDLNTKVNLSYHGIKEDYEQIDGEWETLDKETRPKIEQTMEYFSRFTDDEPEEAEVDKITKEAEQRKTEFATLYTRHNEMSARACVDPETVEKRCEYSMKMKSQIVSHGKNALIAAVLLGIILGGVIAWTTWNGEILYVVFGVLIGGGVTLGIGGLTCAIFTAVAVTAVKKWEALQTRASEFRDMGKKIDRIAEKLYGVHLLLDMIASKEETVKEGSIQLVEKCREYISAATT